MKISTHTLTWSVTRSFTIFSTASLISTHTLTWSVTYCFWFLLGCYDISTHTLTWSVTYYCNRLGLFDNDFNSHAHVERDFAGCLFSPLLDISTHTLTWSVTIAEYKITGLRNGISTHTLTWSVTEKLVVESIDIIISTHTLTWSVTACIKYSSRTA